MYGWQVLQQRHPGEYNSAKAYLNAAEHEKNKSDYDAAGRFVAKAVGQANKALEKSK